MQANMAKRKSIGKTVQSQTESEGKSLVSGKELQVYSISEKLGEIDLDVVERELRQLVLEIEATNTKLEKSKAVTHETLKLVVSL
jgi:hypothetical protein